jgi:branched-chain amino acid transport system ATP-binding protein
MEDGPNPVIEAERKAHAAHPETDAAGYGDDTPPAGVEETKR